MLGQYNSNIHNLLTNVQKEYQDSYTSHQTPKLKLGACISPHACPWNRGGYERTGDRPLQPSGTSRRKSPHTERSTQVVLAYRTLVLMPIGAWYASCKLHATKPFLSTRDECLCNSLHTVSRTIVSWLSRLVLNSHRQSTQRLSTALRGSRFFLPKAFARGL